MSSVLRHEIRKVGCQEVVKTLKEMYNPLTLKLAMMDDVPVPRRTNKTLQLLYLLFSNGGATAKQLRNLCDIRIRDIEERLNDLLAIGLVEKRKDMNGVAYWRVNDDL